jgi:cAMP-binding proteins - catabolite gene activator and regulatory subunit of cAMP-dependent protein kinases
MERNVDVQTRLTMHSFLAGMNAHQIELLASCASFRQFQEGEVIFRAGEPANGFYLIEKGFVAIEEWVSGRGTITIETLSAGEPLGWSWIFPPYVWHFLARATRPTAALFFDGMTLHRFCHEDLTLGHELFKRMSQVMVQRLQSCRATLIEALKPTSRR